MFSITTAGQTTKADRKTSKYNKENSQISDHYIQQIRNTAAAAAYKESLVNVQVFLKLS